MKCLIWSKTSVGSRHAEKEKVEGATQLKGQATVRKVCATDSRKAPCSPGSPTVSRHGNADFKGPHNKENCKKKRCSLEELHDNDFILRNSSLAEDSGYLSLNTSQVDHGDTDPNSAETLGRCPEETESRLSLDVCSSSKSVCLPVLKFQEEVCKELAKGYRKKQSYDWTVIDKIAENYGLHNVIGGKMGLDNMDILCGLLKKDMKHILTQILALLGESDLINCKTVSKTWWKIIRQDGRAFQRCRQAEKMRTVPERSAGSLSRDFGLNRVVLSCLQSVASSTPVHKPTKSMHQTDSTFKPSRFTEFREAAKSLKVHEALRRCRLCNAPARFNAAAQRAVCMRVSCAFDFCSVCQSAYHGSAPCQRGVVRSSPSSQTAPIACSTRSKRNVRRL